jgi:hypothetical protein
MSSIRRSSAHYPLWFLTLVLLMIAASRIVTLYELELHTDEIWSIWQTFGTPEQIIRWTPYDWPPLYYLLLGGWKELVGIQPYVLRVFSVLAFLPGVAILYRVMRRLRDEKTALIVILVYSALGFTMRISSEVRGYMLMITLLLLAFWMLVRYFDHPSVRRAIPLAVSMAGAFYLYLPSVIGFVMLGLYSLIVYRHKVWQWWLPGLIALALAVPLIIDKLPQAGVRIAATDADAPQTLIEALGENFVQFTVFRYVDYPVIVWVALFLLATVLIVWRWREATRVTWAFFAWVIVLPLLLFALNPWFKFFDKHYSMALVIGIAVWVGWGLAYLRREAYVPLLVGLSILVVFPFRLDYYESFWRPLSANFEWLSERLQPGDVVLIDPNKGVDKYYEWAYASQLYFPNGLQFVTDPTGYRRVWYVTFEGKRDPVTDAAVRQGRLEREFVGPANFFFRLYEAPPDPEGVLFENGMRFHGMDVLDESGNIYHSGPLLTRHEGETLRVRLWWTVDETPPADYSVGLYLFERGRDMVDQTDSAPQVVSLEYPPDIPPQETSRWTPGRFYVEERELRLPYVETANLNTYRIYLTVYQWWDNTRLTAPGVDENRLLLLQTIRTETW